MAAGGRSRARVFRRSVATCSVRQGRTAASLELAGGSDTADNIAGAELRIVPGMGHDLPPALYDIFVATMCRAVERAHATV